MRNIGGFQFPEIAEGDHGKGGKALSQVVDAEWAPVIYWTALHHRVLCAARTRIEGAWSAYCGPVIGQNHGTEWQDVLDHGSKLPECVAVAIFPDLAEVPYVN